MKAATAKPNGRLELPRRIKPGSELVRTWNRRDLPRHGAGDGFAYDGKTYASLSEIASRDHRHQMERAAVLWAAARRRRGGGAADAG